MSKLFKPPYWLAWFAILTAIVTIALASSEDVWRLLHADEAAYGKYFVRSFEVPLALALLLPAIGAARLGMEGRYSAKPAAWLWSITALIVVVGVLLYVMALMPSTVIPVRVPLKILQLYMPVILPLTCIVAVVGIVIARRVAVRPQGADVAQT